MAKLEGTKTIINLMKAFAGESQARNRYTYFASVANKEGYRQIEALFLETADNEKEHAKMFYKYIANDLKANKAVPLEITASYPVAFGTTYDNLIAAAEGEHEEWAELYIAFAEEAENEGFAEIGKTFREIASVEKHHEARYLKLADNIKNDKVFKKDASIAWKCRNCGYIYEGAEAPAVCPACKHPKAHFEVHCEAY